MDIKNLKVIVEEFNTAPTIDSMPKRSLIDKGINGPTAAHVIEEVHTPLNLAYLTFTTGSTAFQNIVGVTINEIEDRIKATQNLFRITNIPTNAKILFTYAPLVNLFPNKALEVMGTDNIFMYNSSRDAFLLALLENEIDVVIGESSFIRAALIDANRMNYSSNIKRDIIVLVAGTPLDDQLISECSPYGWQVHDLYGCQEFGWLVVDGIPLRDDISLVTSPLGGEYKELVVGGLPTADSFIVSETDIGHICNSSGKIITYRRKRTHPEYEVFVKETTLSSADSIDRVARTILRIKSRIVKVSSDIKTSAPETVLELRQQVLDVRADLTPTSIRIHGSQKTKLFDDLQQAQLDLQQNSKTDNTWIKKR